MKSVITLILAGLLILAGFNACKSDESPTTGDQLTATPTPTATVTITPTLCSSIGSFGGSVISGNANQGYDLTLASNYTTSNNGAITALSFYAYSGDHFKVGVYSDNAGAPGNLLSVSGPVTASSTGWVLVPISAAWVPAGTCWLAVKFDISGSGSTYQTNVSSGSVHSCNCDFVNPWSGGSTISTINRVGIYAHYRYCP